MMLKSDDNDLFLNALNGRTELHGVLFERHSKGLFNFILLIVKRSEVAEELVQESFLKAIKKAKDFNPDFKYSTWLYRIGKNSALDYLRKRKEVLNDSLIEEEIQIDESIEEKLWEESKKETIQRGIKELPLRQREALAMWMSEEFTNIEIASELKCSEQAVKNLINRARKNLVDRLKVDL